MPSVVLALLLVFRTNTAYERFWEGRKAWGDAINASRSLARLMMVAIVAKDVEAERKKREEIRLLAAFGFSLKQHLRDEAIEPAMVPLMSPQFAQNLQKSNHLPLEILYELGSYMQSCYQQQQVNLYQLTDLHHLLDTLTDVVGTCERIIRTPVPMAYSIHIRQLLFVYCLTIPFVFVEEFGLWTAAVVGLVAFTVFGIEEIGLEIENPFGHDPNDLPLDRICGRILDYIESLLRSAE